MTAITGVTTADSPWQGNDPSKSSMNFAHELAKEDSSAHGDAKAFAGNEKAGLRGSNVSREPESEASMEPSRAAMADQDQGTSVEQLSAEMQLQDRATAQPVGVTEALLGARVFGWHALAQSYLSELALSDAMPDEEVLPEEANAMLIQSQSPVEEVASGDATELAEAPSTMEAPGAMAAESATAGSESANEPVAGMDTVDPGLAAASSDYWAERSLRFTRQSDGHGIAWLRDYRLDTAHGGQLVRWVLQQAKANGFTLDRIMLNGREAWSSRGQV